MLPIRFKVSFFQPVVLTILSNKSAIKQGRWRVSFLLIDKEKCEQDGLCAADCPAGIIRFKGKGNFPELSHNDESICLRCGHCVAVCPHNALDHAEVPQAACPPIDRDLEITKAQAIQFLRSRRSMRRFKDQSVEKAVLQQLIEIGRYAPTGSNCQLLEWRVINDRTRLRHVAEQVMAWMRGKLKADPESKVMPYIPNLIKAWERGHDVVLRSAPCLVVAFLPAHDRNGMVHIALALSYLELAAPLFGLGTCWAGLLQGAIQADSGLKQLVGIPANYPHYYPMMIGYSQARYYRLVERNQPRIFWD